VPYFDFRGAKMYYIDLDERDNPSRGLNIIFVHGAGSSRVVWALQLLELRKHHRVIALDLYGHGESDNLDIPPDVYCAFPEEVAALVEHLDLKDFVFVGHSMGGGVIMSYYLTEGFRKPRAMVLADTSLDLDLRKIIMGIVKETLEDHTPRQDYQEHVDDLEKFYLPDYKDIANKVHPLTLLRDLEACDRFDISARVDELTVPILVMVGEDDDIVKPKMARMFAMSLPNAEFVIVKDGDHTPMVEVWDTFNKLLIGFLSGVEENT
jgi:3-oxoadipate enol-lactonase